MSIIRNRDDMAKVLAAAGLDPKPKRRNTVAAKRANAGRISNKTATTALAELVEGIATALHDAGHAVPTEGGTNALVEAVAKALTKPTATPKMTIDSAEDALLRRAGWANNNTTQPTTDTATAKLLRRVGWR